MSNPPSIVAFTASGPVKGSRLFKKPGKVARRNRVVKPRVYRRDAKRIGAKSRDALPPFMQGDRRKVIFEAMQETDLYIKGTLAQLVSETGAGKINIATGEGEAFNDSFNRFRKDWDKFYWYHDLSGKWDLDPTQVELDGYRAEAEAEAYQAQLDVLTGNLPGNPPEAQGTTDGALSWTGQDSREAAYQHLDAVKAFIDFVDNDIVENVNKKRLDIKNNQVHHDFVYGENDLYKAWGTFYKQCYADGIGYLDVANVEQKTTDWHNKFIGIQEKNNELVGEENTAAPKTEKEKPPPGAKLPGVDVGALGDLVAPLGIAAVVLVGVALATRR